MNDAARIDRYLANQAILEELNRRQEEVDATTRFIYMKLREFSWTLMRLTGIQRRRERNRGMVGVEREPFARVSERCASKIMTRRPRILIDVTATSRSGLRTGIQRVVREISKRAFENGDGLPVFIENGQLVSYYEHPAIPHVIEISDGDKFLMLDASWRNLEEIVNVMRQVSARGGENIVGLHEIIPLLHPGAFHQVGFLDFKCWFDTVLLAADAVVCISESTARSLICRLEQCDNMAIAPKRIGWFHLGGDLQSEMHLGSSPQAASVLSKRDPFFLSVGSLEPRKGYPIALAAFEELWSEGVDARYVIVGRTGWQSRALERRILRHAEFGKRLFWFRNADDATLRDLYGRAMSLVCPSCAEGFGLPIAEAAYRGLPVIASDIPVFREVAGDHARFFEVLDSAALAERIREALAGVKPACSSRIWTWRESEQGLMRLIRDDAYQWRNFRADQQCLIDDVDRRIMSR